MDALHIVLSLAVLISLLACAWLMIDRARLLAARAQLGAEKAGQASRADAAEHRLGEQALELSTLDERLDRATQDVVRLTEQIEGERRAHKSALEDLRERDHARAEHERRTMEQLDRRYKEAFEALAAKTLEASSSRFLERAKEAFDQHKERADHTFDEKRQKIEEMVRPIREALLKTDERLTQLDKGRVASSAELKEHLQMLATQTQGLSAETQRLVRSLKAPHVRGRWGELQLRRVVELAGMSAHCDFDEQASVEGDEGAGRLRPDMIVHLPGGRCIVVDAKASLANYLEAIEADTDERKRDRFKAHARDVRSRVDDLASKGYQSRLRDQGTTPDFAVLFVPGDQFLSAALLEQPDLLEHAASKSVILTTPATLIALLKAVSFGWTQASLEDDAREILKLGTELHDRVATMTEHLGKVGQHLGRTVGAYNSAVGSFEARVLPGARKIGELVGPRTKKVIERQEQVLTEPKRPDAPEEAQPQQPLLVDPDGADPRTNGSS